MAKPRLSDSRAALESLGLVEFLEVLGRPACIAQRVACQPESSATHEAPSSSDGRIEIVWSNQLMTPGLQELISLSSIPAASYASEESVESREVVTEVPGQTVGRQFRWNYVSLRGGQFWAISGMEEACGASPSVNRTLSSAVTKAESLMGPSSEPEVSDVFVPSSLAADTFDWLSVVGRTPESRRFIDTFRNVDWSSGKLGPPISWNQSLLTMVNACLSSPFPVLLSWGSDMVLL
jgi:hypothetical protein